MSKLIKILCMNNNTVKRILIVGYGNIGKRHSEIIKRLYPKIAIAVLRRSKCKSIKNCFVSIDEAIEFQPNMAIIANPSSLHIDIAMVLAKNSTHLLIEKPISKYTRILTLCEIRWIKWKILNPLFQSLLKLAIERPLELELASALVVPPRWRIW